MRHEIQKTANELATKCGELLENIWKQKGFLPSSHQFLFSRDPAFTLARRIRVFATTPHLRWELIASFFVHVFAGSRKRKRGRSHILARTSKWSGEAATFYFNGLLLELMHSLASTAQKSGWEAEFENQILKEFETDALRYPQGTGTVSAWAYFPAKHHRFQSGNWIYTFMHQWGGMAADLDSSSMVLTQLIKSRSEAITCEDALVLLEEHARFTGIHGKNRLAYDNGVFKDDGGVLLWVHEKHNELDAGVNVNILCLLVALLERMDARGRDRVAALAIQVWNFLARHIATGDYANPHFLMFYSLEAFAFLWYRLAVCMDGLSPTLRAQFDPLDSCGALGSHLATEVALRWEENPPSYNSFDRLLVLPLLLRHQSPSAAAMLTPASLKNMVQDVSTHAYEFGKFLYPFTFLYGNQALGLYAALHVFKLLQPVEMAEEVK